MIAEITGYNPYSVKIVYYLSNHRGDTMLAYRNDNGTETLVARYLYDAFGNRRTDSNYCYENQNETDNLPRYTFSTKEFLSDAELYLYAYRAYDPIAGRWTQRDPIDYQDSINLYQFCGNNPVNNTDADGRKSWYSDYIKPVGKAFYKGIKDFTISISSKKSFNESLKKGYKSFRESLQTDALEGRGMGGVEAKVVSKVYSHVVKGDLITKKAGSDILTTVCEEGAVNYASKYAGNIYSSLYDMGKDIFGVWKANVLDPYLKEVDELIKQNGKNVKKKKNK